MTQIERLNMANKNLQKNHSQMVQGIEKQMQLLEALRKMVSMPQGRNENEK